MLLQCLCSDGLNTSMVQLVKGRFLMRVHQTMSRDRYRLATDIESHFISPIGTENGCIVTTRLNTVTVHKPDDGREGCPVAIIGLTVHHRRQPLYSSHIQF